MKHPKAKRRTAFKSTAVTDDKPAYSHPLYEPILELLRTWKSSEQKFMGKEKPPAQLKQRPTFMAAELRPLITRISNLPGGPTILHILRTTNIPFLDPSPKINGAWGIRYADFLIGLLEYKVPFTAKIMTAKDSAVWPLRHSIIQIITGDYFWDNLTTGPDSAPPTMEQDLETLAISHINALMRQATKSCHLLYKSLAQPGIGLIAVSGPPSEDDPLQFSPIIYKVYQHAQKVSFKILHQLILHLY